jgi:large subunit ribosomal protein L35
MPWFGRQGVARSLCRLTRPQVVLRAPAGANQKEQFMPKMKTKSSAKKRFRVRPGGTVKRGQAFKRHILTKKSTKTKRHLRGATSVHKTDMGGITKMLPFAGL